MSSSGVGVNAGGSANEAPEIPDNVGDWLRGVYRFATDRNDFRRHMEPVLYLNLPKAEPPVCDHHKTCLDGS
ncbi:Mitochondrial import receptor subunit TOM6 like protein [Pteropus alecto]|uniref:Mitochondrial import receptor subunit TOM6 like protein n=1 Tax=Pteropus alecto TaxID=9402 RepID=L5JN06_PTEAL|nr:Mitochondrial import receptor subunit TOM6 like protein [Pteropus alecto]